MIKCLYSLTMFNIFLLNYIHFEGVLTFIKICKYNFYNLNYYLKMNEITYIFPIKNNNRNKNQINFGIQILRTILSYLILQFHCYNIKLTNNKILILLIQAFHFYVPTFYIISFFFSYNIIKLKIINKIKLRIERILIPYLIWPFLFFLMKNIKYYIYGEKKYMLKDLIIQYLTGKRIYEIFWYLCNLILSFILYCIIALLYENKFLLIIQLIGIVGSLYYPYHYYNKLFNKYIKEIRTLIQDFSKVLFYGAIGASLSSIKLINNLQKYRARTIFFCLYVLFLIRDFLQIINLFFYLRCIIFGIGALTIFILFLILPLDNIKNKSCHLLIIHLTNYSGGVYYLHLKVKEILNNKLIIVKNGTLVGCFLNYILCYFICFLGIKVFGGTILKYLFY